MQRSAALQRPETVGLVLLVLTATGWGLNWPAMKALLQELPPLSARGWAGLAGAAGLAAVATVLRQPLGVRPTLWGRLLWISLLNVTAWMGLATFSLLWLSAGEATIVCYTMPVWASLLAWPVLGERPSLGRVLALATGLSGVLVLLLGQGFEMGAAKLPGVAFGLGAAILFSLGTVLTKRAPLDLPPMTAVVWQVGLDCAPLLLVAFVLERPDFAGLSPQGWASMAYMAAGPLCL